VTVADTNAVVAIIESVPILASGVTVTFWPSNKPPATPPWVIVHPAEGNDDSDRLTAPGGTSHPSFTLHIVGSQASQVQTVTGLVKAKFVDGRDVFTPPTITGRLNQGGYWNAPIPIQIDDSVIPNLAYQVIEMGWESQWLSS